MLRILALLVALVAIASSVTAEPLPEAFAQGRDLRSYVDGGVYHAVLGTSIADVKRLRKFVWTHWAQKRRGYVQVVFSDIDAGIQTYLLIEPVNGRWGIVWCDIPYSAYGGSNSPRPEYAPTIRGAEHCRGSLIFFDEHDKVVKCL